MLCTWTDKNKVSTGALLCYKDPLCAEEEQENPFLVHERYFMETETRFVLSYCILIQLSGETPEINYGSISYSKNQNGKLLFYQSYGEQLTLYLDGMTEKNMELERLSNTNGVDSRGPIWEDNGGIMEIMFQNLSLLDFEQTLDAKTFVSHWLASLIVSNNAVIRIFVKRMISNSDDIRMKYYHSIEEIVDSQIETSIVWVYFPASKPRNLKKWIENLHSLEKVDLTCMSTVGVSNAGFYLASFVFTKGNYYLNLVDPVDSTILCYPESEGESDTSELKQFPINLLSESTKGWNLVFNYNFTFNVPKSAPLFGHVRYGIWGDTGYATAHCYPIRLLRNKGQEVYPHDPLRSDAECRKKILPSNSKKVKIRELKQFSERWKRNALDLSNTFIRLGFPNESYLKDLKDSNID